MAPTAVLSGRVSIGAGNCVLYGAVLATEGSPVQAGQPQSRANIM